jgi:hypothetical protein
MMTIINRVFSSSFFFGQQWASFCTKKPEVNKSQEIIAKFTDQLDEGK